VILLKINNTLLNNLIFSNKNNFIKEILFKEGSIFKGKILEINENTALINIPEFGILEAMLDITSQISTDQQILFLVESVYDNKIYLKPLQDDLKASQSYYKENSILKLLAEIGIEKNEATLKLVENLMSYNFPINRDALIKAVTILEKLNVFSKLSEEIKVILPYNSNNTLLDISDKDIGQLDIRYLFVTNEKLDNEIENSISNSIKDYIINQIKFDDNENFIKITSYLIRNNIEPTLRNLKFIKELDENPEKFFEDIQEIFKLAKYDNVLKIEDKSNEKNIKNEILDDFKIITTKKENIEELKKIIKETLTNNKEELKFKELENKLSFIRELANNDIFLMFFPINYDINKKLHGLITLIKESKKKSITNKLSIFMNLNTQNLGNLRILCVLEDVTLSIKMSINKEDYDFFKLNESRLIDKILALGFKIRDIEYITENKISILDTQNHKSISSYILDLKV